MVDIQCPTAEIRRGNKKRKKKPQDETIFVRILRCRVAIKKSVKMCIGEMMIVWRVRVKTVRSVLCFIVYECRAQCNAHIYEQT